MKSPKIALLLFFSCTLGSCNPMRANKHASDTAFEELRSELADVKHTLHGYEVELSLLEEKLHKQEKLLSEQKAPPKSSPLEGRLSQVEKKQEKVAGDLKSLSQHASQTSTTLSQYKEKLQAWEELLKKMGKEWEEIGKLKNTLSSLSQALSSKGYSLYKVKAGDSLEKIARSHGVTLDTLKRTNSLETDRIFVGQEIKIPQDAPSHER